MAILNEFGFGDPAEPSVVEDLEAELAKFVSTEPTPEQQAQAEIAAEAAAAAEADKQGIDETPPLEVKAKVEETPPVETDEIAELQERIREQHIKSRQDKKKAIELQKELDILRGNIQVPRDEQVTREAQQMAQNIARQEAWDTHCNRIGAAGKAEFKDFDNVIKEYAENFPEVGGVPQPLIACAIEAAPGEEAKLIHWLGKNLDEAERIMSLSPVKAGAALAKIAAKLSAPVVKTVSKAPSPVRPIVGIGPKVANNVDTMSEAKFMEMEREYERKKYRH